MSNSSAKIPGWERTFADMAIDMQDEPFGERPYAHYESDLGGEAISIQFSGWAIVLLPNGKWYPLDTSGA